jgi:hypothetical protein
VVTSDYQCARAGNTPEFKLDALFRGFQIALFVAPALVVLSYVIGPTPMSLQFWPAAAAMILIATMTAFVATNSGRSAWFLGGALARRIFDFRHDAILVAAQNSLNRVKERRMPLALISFHRGTL